jgi:hypothetical protein
VQPLARLEPCWRERDSLCPVFIARERAQFLEFGNGAFGIQTHARIMAAQPVFSNKNPDARALGAVGELDI